MKSKYVIILALLFLFQTAWSQQNSCPCCTEVHRQFDFWVGEWEVYNAQGQQIGSSLVEAVEGGCVLQENWKATKGGTGRSFNYLNLQDSTWNQLWLDNTGNKLKLKGGLRDGKMILETEYYEQAGEKLKNQIVWEKLANNEVRQSWYSVDSTSQIKQIVFVGTYRPKTK
jgi:hypothetical protein